MKFILIIFIFTFSSLTSANEELSFQQEIAIERLITAVEQSDYNGISRQLSVLRDSGVVIKGELLYYEALGQFGRGAHGFAMLTAEAYIKENGKEGKFYREAIELLSLAANQYELDIIASSRIEYARSYMVDARPADNTTGANEHLFNHNAYELKVADQIYKNNNDGTISVFSLVPENSSSYQNGPFHLVRVDLMSCPIGADYDPSGQNACVGKAKEFNAKHIDDFMKDFSYGGFSDWRLPTSYIYKNDKIFGFVNPDIPGTSFAADYWAQRGYEHGGTPDVSPHQFLFNKKATIEIIEIGNYRQIPEFIWDYKPAFVSSNINEKTGPICYDPNPSYTTLIDPICRANSGVVVVPIRGPFILESGLQGKCGSSQLRITGRTSCTVESKPGKIFKLNPEYYINN